MSRRPRLLDLFCGAQGAGEGYARAGYAVTGVDHEPHPDAPHPVIVADALELLTDASWLDQFAVVHASPPCQGYTTMNRWRGKTPGGDVAPRLIGQVQDALRNWGGTYVIENVPGAAKFLRAPVRLRGGMFGLGVDRPRLFETNADLPEPPPCFRVPDPLGVYGPLDGRKLWTRADGTTQHAPRTLDQARAAMGIDWMQWDDLREAIPPAYTEWIGRQLLKQQRKAVAS